MPLTPHDFRRELARRHDAAIVQAIADRVATACPFPTVVYFEPDYGRLRVRVGGATVATVDPAALGPDLPSNIDLIARLTLDRYCALEPLEHDHHLGTN